MLNGCLYRSMIAAAVLALLSMLAIALHGTIGRETEEDTFEAALAFVETAYQDPLYMQMANRSMDSVVRQAPELEAHPEALLRYYEEQVAREEWHVYLAHEYAEAFSVAELDAMRAFYGTETGRKALVHSPAMLDEALQWVIETTVEHGREINELIREHEHRDGGS